MLVDVENTFCFCLLASCNQIALRAGAQVTCVLSTHFPAGLDQSADQTTGCTPDHDHITSSMVSEQYRFRFSARTTSNKVAKKGIFPKPRPCCARQRRSLHRRDVEQSLRSPQPDTVQTVRRWESELQGVLKQLQVEPSRFVPKRHFAMLHRISDAVVLYHPIS